MPNNQTSAINKVPGQSGLADGLNRDLLGGTSPRIMVLTRKGHMSQAVISYAVNVAQRLGYSVLAVYVNTLPLLRSRNKRGHQFAMAVDESAREFLRQADDKQVAFSYICESGKVGTVTQRICRAVKRIEFIVADQDLRIADVAPKSPVPVFSVIARANEHRSNRAERRITQFWKGERTMSKAIRSRYIKRSLVFGVAAAALYAGVFSNAELLMSYCKQGGVYALVPVATVFLFSYIHGSFTSAFWSALGVEGSKHTATRQAVQESEKKQEKTVRKDTRPRLHA